MGIIQFWKETLYKNYTPDQISYFLSLILDWKIIIPGAILILAILGYLLRYKIFRFLFQHPYIKITEKSLKPTISDGMLGFTQTTFIKYDIYNPASHENLIIEQTIFIFPRWKTFKHHKNNISIPKFNKETICFSFKYEEISKHLKFNIGKIKIIDIKNKKITSLINPYRYILRPVEYGAYPLKYVSNFGYNCIHLYDFSLEKPSGPPYHLSFQLVYITGIAQV